MERKRVIVDTLNGKLQGSHEQTFLGDTYYAFKGIPYAKSPVGPLRFQDPQPAERWTGIRDATTHGSISAQYDAQAKKVVDSEDCLYLNVYTRNLNASSSRVPVMFWIHGGAFQYGSGNDDMFGPDFLLSKNVVLVTINYRLGIFGFFNMGNKAATGNQGLKDQVMALKWVRNNVANFGGDPENVTIFGASAGAASVHYLTMSKMAKGLFHRAICQSWTALAPYTITREPNQVDLFEFLERLDCEKQSSEVVLDYLKSISFERLIEVQDVLTTRQRRLQGRYLFLPTIDDKSEEPFLPISSAEAAKQGVQVPLMLGWNGKEGLVYLNHIQKLNLSDVDRHLENYTSPFINELLQSNDLTLKELRYLYLKNDPIDEETLPDTLEYYGDLMFVENVHRLAKIQVNSSSAPTYLYKLSFEKNLSLSKMQLNTTIAGPNHGDELTYLFKAKVCDNLNFEQLQEGTGGDRVMRQMVELWTNFAKTGRPTLRKSELLPLFWQPVTNDVVLHYLNIDEELKMEKTLNLDQRYSYKSSGIHYC